MNAYRKSLAELRAETLHLVNDPDGERYAASDVDDEINFAAMRLSLEAELLRSSLPVTLILNIATYDLAALATAYGGRDFAFPLRIGRDTDETLAPERVPRQALDRYGLNPYTTGALDAWSRDDLDPQSITVFRTPSEAGDVLDITYAGFPAWMTDDGDFPDAGIPPMFHQAVPLGAAAMLLLASEVPADQRQAERLLGEFQRWIIEAGAHLTSSRTSYEDFSPC